jgi:chemotaxis response regulator CheB
MRVVATAADAAEAFRVAEELQPDTLVLDADLLNADAATLRGLRARLGINIVLLNVDKPTSRSAPRVSPRCCHVRLQLPN